MRASRSMLGVWYRSLSGVRSSWKGTEVSCHPMSSTRKKSMFGRGSPFGAAASFFSPAVPCAASGSAASVKSRRLFMNFRQVGAGQYLKLLPPMNSRRIDVGGISSGAMGMKLSRNLSMRRASSYSGTVSGTSRRIFSAKGRRTEIS